MIQRGQDSGQVFADSLWAAGQVDDEGAPADAGGAPAQHGLWRDLQAFIAHGFRS